MDIRVTVDGKNYSLSQSQQKETIGVFITTTGQRDCVYHCLENCKKYLPEGAKLFLIVDTSHMDLKDALNAFGDGDRVKIRPSKSRGIVAAKNKCLAIAEDRKLDHVFLFDDDCWPNSPDWHRNYVNSKQAHLCYQFSQETNSGLGDISPIFSEGNLIGYTGQRGVMLYYKKIVIDTCGAFDDFYGVGMYEHCDYALRIFSAGLTASPFLGLRDEDKITSLDETNDVQRSIPLPERQQLVEVNQKYYNKKLLALYNGELIDIYIRNPIRQKKIKLLSVLLNNIGDPQRAGCVNADISEYSAAGLIDSSMFSNMTLITDNPRAAMTAYPSASIAEASSDTNLSVYFYRWTLLLNELIGSELDGVVITDATDVIQLNPVPDCAFDDKTIFVGDEPDLINSKWMEQNHAHEGLRDYCFNHPDKKLYNAGILGGNYSAVIKFLTILNGLVQARELIRRISMSVDTDDFDMLAFNAAVRKMSELGYKVISGPMVNTVFKSEGQLGSPKAWFKHK